MSDQTSYIHYTYSLSTWYIQYIYFPKWLWTRRSNVENESEFLSCRSSTEWDCRSLTFHWALILLHEGSQLQEDKKHFNTSNPIHCPKTPTEIFFLQSNFYRWVFSYWKGFTRLKLYMLMITTYVHQTVTQHSHNFKHLTEKVFHSSKNHFSSLN